MPLFPSPLLAIVSLARRGSQVATTMVGVLGDKGKPTTRSGGNSNSRRARPARKGRCARAPLTPRPMRRLAKEQFERSKLCARSPLGVNLILPAPGESGAKRARATESICARASLAPTGLAAAATKLKMILAPLRPRSSRGARPIKKRHHSRATLLPPFSPLLSSLRPFLLLLL